MRVEFKSKAVVHLDQHKAPIASASLADNGSVHTVAINALTVFDVVHAYQLSKGKKYASSSAHARDLGADDKVAGSDRLENDWSQATSRHKRGQGGGFSAAMLRTSVDNSQGRLPRLGAGCLLIWRQCVCVAPTRTGVRRWLNARSNHQKSKIKRRPKRALRPTSCPKLREEKQS